MAYSSSIKLCELCQGDSIKWRCLDCDRCICEKCKTSHLRIPVTAKHQIVAIETPLQDVQKKITIDNIPCKDHPNKMTCLFCKSCSSLICLDCACTTHNRHNFDSLASALDTKLEYWRDIQDKIDDNLKCCKSKISEIEKIKHRFNTVFNESIANIKKKEEILIDSIRTYSKELQEQIKKEMSQVNRDVSKIEEDVGKTKKKLENQRDKIDVILTSNQGSDIFNLKAIMTTDDLKFDLLPNHVWNFVSVTESKEKIQDIFGSLQKVLVPIPITKDLPLVDFEVIKTFTTDLPFVDTVVTLDDTSAWINCYKRQVVRKVNIQDNKMKTFHEVSMDVHDMALTSNEVLLSVFGGSDIKLLKRSGEVVSFLTVAPLIPRGIHVTKDNDIMIGVREYGNAFPLKDQSQRFIMVFGMDGQQKNKYHYDKDGKKLFTNPSQITTNNNQDIFVVDGTSDYTGRVVGLTKGGKLRWVYNGYSNDKTCEQFDPRGIVTTTVGHILVSDFNSHACLHVLSSNGEILVRKDIRDMGIIYPLGLYIDVVGRLWVGCGTESKNTGAQLHIIKLVYTKN